jgi:hypothetical protein
METIKGVFLRAKHWQIFVVLLVVPYAAEIVAMIFGNVLVAMAIMGIQVLFWLAWYWSLGSFLSSVVRSELKSSSGFFYFSLVYPIVYMPVFVWLAIRPGMGSAAAIVPPHLLGMFCMFYVLCFVSRNLVMVETGKSASFGGYAGQFFLLWFFPIGLWIVQPKVNQLYGQTERPA